MSYPSATRPNLGEFGVLALLGLTVLLALGLPWLLVGMADSRGLDFDTWKHVQPGAPAQWLLPSGAQDYKDTAAGTLALYGNGLWALAEPFASHAAAVQAWRQRWLGGAWPTGVRGAATEIGVGQWLVYAQNDDGNLLQWVADNYILQLFAPDDHGLSALISASQMIDARGEPRYGKGDIPLPILLLRVNAPVTALILDAVVVLFLIGVYWLGIRRLQVRPAPMQPRLGRESLRNRLLELNNAAAPFIFEQQGPYHLVGRWRLDEAEQAQRLAQQQLRQAYQLDLYLNEGATVGALETTGRIEWKLAGQAYVPRVSWHYLRGIGVGRGKKPPPTLPSAQVPSSSQAAASQQVDLANISALRPAIEQLVVASGWTWRPLLLRPLLWDWR